MASCMFRKVAMTLCIPSHQNQRSCGPQHQLSSKLRIQVETQGRGFEFGLAFPCHPVGFVFAVFNKVVSNYRMITLENPFWTHLRLQHCYNYTLELVSQQDMKSTRRNPSKVAVPAHEGGRIKHGSHQLLMLT